MSNTGFISELQHFSTGDGPGIRTTVFFQGCNLHCEWCHNPETIPLKGSVLQYKNGEKKISGSLMTVQGVMEYILEDMDFYKASGGGVTISGGEPLLQPEFCRALASACNSHQIDVILDTAGNVPYEAFEQVLPYIKTIFFDLKANCIEDYKQRTGGSFDLIIDNLKQLVENEVDVVVRIPVIPGHNDSMGYMEKYADILLDCGIKRVDLLPFHRLGSSKYTALGRDDYRYKDIKTMHKDELRPFISLLKDRGLDAKIDG